MSVSTTGARRISAAASQQLAASERRADYEPIVNQAFTSVCATVLLAAFIMSVLLAMGSARPVPDYAIFGSALFGFVIAAFLMGALHLAITDSRRTTDDHH